MILARALVDAYFEEARTMTYETVRASQQAPLASVGLGASGIAYAAWRGRRREEAARWLREVARHAREPSAFGTDATSDGSIVVEHAERSILYGPLGVAWTNALLRGTAPRAFIGVADGVRAWDSGELLYGAAGYLDAARILHRRTRDARLRDAADRVARDLLEREGWWRTVSLGFARGAAGVLHALLAWSRELDRDLPPVFWRALDELAGKGPLERDPVLAQSWCNGNAGLVLLWVAAFERTGDERWRKMARRSARAARRRVRQVNGSLCCGLGGRAYAMLAMHRIAPDEGWREVAERMCEEAIEGIDGRWRHGLLRGYPGLVCLALDLLAKRPRGFPLVEG